MPIRIHASEPPRITTQSAKHRIGRIRTISRPCNSHRPPSATASSPAVATSHLMLVPRATLLHPASSPDPSVQRRADQASVFAAEMERRQLTPTPCVENALRLECDLRE